MRWIAYLGSLIGYLIASSVLAQGVMLDGLVLWLIAAILMFFVVLIHELGHAGAVLWFRGTISRIMVFPFEYDVRNRRLGMAKTRHRGDVGGFVAYTLDRINPRTKHVLIAAAGPAANLVAVVFCIGLTFIFALVADQRAELVGNGMLPSYAEVVRFIASENARRGWEAARAVAAAYAVLSVSAALCNLIPFGGSDGQHIVRGLRERKLPLRP